MLFIYKGAPVHRANTTKYNISFFKNILSQSFLVLIGNLRKILPCKNAIAQMLDSNNGRTIFYIIFFMKLTAKRSCLNIRY